MHKDVDIAIKYLNLMKNANDRGKEFKLTFGHLKKVMKRKTCGYSGVEMIEYSPTRPSIDRLDNNKGYVNGNLILCAENVNKLKSNLTMDELIKLTNVIKKHKNGIQ